MPLDIFQQNWFSHQSLQALSKRLHGQEKDLAAMEKQFLANIFLQCLDAGLAKASEVEEIANFFCFAFPRRGRSHSQIMQDLWVLFYLKEKKDGYFVEFGACDGVLLSNTLLLEKDYGWTGILAEPNPVWHEGLRANRTCSISTKCVHHKSGEQVSFSCSTIPELSRLSGVVPDDVHEQTGNRKEDQNITVETITLQELLANAGAPHFIDYLSIDTEGSEELILRDFDFNAYKFGCITIEHAGEKQKQEAIFQLLTQNGYHRWHPEMSRWDDWYVLNRPDIVQQLHA